MTEIASAAPIADLSDEQRQELARTRHLRVGKDLVWVELDGTVRRQRFDKVYYFQTSRGVYRVSRIDGEVVEV